MLVKQQLTLEVSEELAQRLEPFRERWARILELGLREMAATTPGFTGAAEVLEFLASLPSPQEILALRPSPALQGRIRALLEKSRTVGLAATEQEEWSQYEYLEHLVRLAKAKAAMKLKAA